MEELATDDEVYEDARGEILTEEQSNNEFEDVQSEKESNEFIQKSVGNKKDKTKLSDENETCFKDGEKNKPNVVPVNEKAAKKGTQDTDLENSKNEISHRESNEKQNEISDSDQQFTEEELNDKLIRSTDLKDKGNLHFKNQEYDKSLELYMKALVECPDQFSDKKAIILNNKAVCRWRLLEKSSDTLNFKDEKTKAEFEQIIEELSKAIELNPTYFKPYLKRAEFNHRFGGDKLNDSLQDYQKVLEMLPNENHKLKEETMHEIAKLQKEIDEQNEKLKQEMFAQLKNLGNLCLRPFGLSTDNFKLQQNENGGYSVNFQK